MVQYSGYFLLAIIALFLFGKIFTLSIKFIIKLVLNGILGVILLLAVNFLEHFLILALGLMCGHH